MAQRWMFALQRQVRATWIATIDNATSLCEDHGMEVDVEPVAVELTFALVAVRVLDKEVFTSSHGLTYEGHRNHECAVINGMTLIRNTAVHVTRTLDPRVERALSVPWQWRSSVDWPYQGQFQLLPSWVQWSELPTEIARHERTREGVRTDTGRH